MRRLVASALAAGVAVAPAWAQVGVETCPQTSDPGAWSGATLEADTARSGVVYDTGDASLELERAAGLFRSASLTTADTFVYTAVADFDRDGWDDFVAAGEATTFLKVYRNRTFDNPEPDWTDPGAIRAPKFTMVRQLISATSNNQLRPTVAADFDGDGWPDVLHVIANWYGRPTSARMWLNRAVNDAAGNPQFGTPYTAITAPSIGGYQTWSGTSIQAYDWNGDRKLDVLIGSGENNGEIRVLLNNCTLANPQPAPVPAAPAPLRCANNPTFSYAATLISGLGTGTNVSGGLPVFAYGLFDGDAYPDLVVGAPILSSDPARRLRLYRGRAGNALDTASPQAIDFVGGATGVLAADFSQDGRLDLIVTSDNWHYGANVVGGMSHYYVNDGTATPFAAGPRQRLTDHSAPTFDFDVGLVLDYDHDPNRTPDALVADGNHTASYYVLANRVVDQYVECGEAASGIMDLGALAGSEMVVTAARLDPSVILDGGTVRFYLSNEEPPNWVEATDCGDGSGDLCATFPRSSGREVRWKAVMCSNAAHTRTPHLASISATFDFARATEHYRSGTVVHDGVAYLGAFRQPGDRGRFYAVNAGLDRTYWEGSAKLDAMADADRRIYTMHRDTGERLDFRHTGGSVDVGLLATMGLADPAQAAAVIDWTRGPRFGVGNSGIPLSRLGAVETSTPAVLTRPPLPVWYVFASRGEREQIDAFLAAQADRRDLVLFGSKDGMIHALHARASDITNPRNGQEAWAFVPTEVAAGLAADYANSLDGTLDVTVYPDGSPTLADVADAAGNLSTVAIVGGGNGGRSISALDVTETVDPDTEAILGPTPLWTAVPGDAAAGQAFAKVAIARVSIDGQTRFIAIAGTGAAFDDLTPPYEQGRLVAAYDVLTGELLWRFQTRCPLTSHVTVFETDDEREPGGPRVDGLIDRAVFADRCGYVYKVDPARALGGGWNGNEGLGGIATDLVDGVQLHALFSTRETAGALAAESPITGAIGAQIEAGTSRVVLFFGTGGLEQHAIDQPNEFYAVYADDGSIRAKLAGRCDGGRCEKFYGGVVVTRDQVMVTRTVDPEVGTGRCDRGASVVQGLRLNAVEDGALVEDFARSVGSAVMGALYGDAGAVYFATLGGDLHRIGQARAEDAGGDSGSGTGSGTGTGTGPFDPEVPMTMMGWRQVY